MNLKKLIQHNSEQYSDSFEYVKNSDFNKRLDDGEIDGYELYLKKPDNTEISISPISAVLFNFDKPTYREMVKEDVEGSRDNILNVADFPDNLSAFDRLLVLVKNKAKIIPFIGAGFSVASGCPVWSNYISDLAISKTGMDEEEVKKRLGSGEHEALMDEVIDSVGIDVFQRDFRSKFEGSLIIPALSPSSNLASLFNECYITTNFDRVLEGSHHSVAPFTEKVMGVDDTGRFLKAIYRCEKYLLKLHGNIDEQRDRILTKAEYNSGYGNDDVDVQLPIPRTLSRIFSSFSVLFLGCSLIQDRYLDVLNKVYASGPNLMPDHFAILVAPEDDSEMQVRDRYMATLGITPIWFKSGDWDKPSEIIDLILTEL